MKREFNYKRRHEFIETDYINGVTCPITGKQVIRPLTDEEKDFLNKFYSETVSTLTEDPETDFYPDKKEFYKLDYRRRNDIFSENKIRGTLDEFQVDKYDELISKKLKGLDYEDLIINDLDRKIKKESYLKKYRKIIKNNRFKQLKNLDTTNDDPYDD